MPLGMQDGRILKNMISASSVHSSTAYRPFKARLYFPSGSWFARIRNTHQWLQIDLGVASIVRLVATQGSYNGYWIKKYTLSYSNKGFRFTPYKEGKYVRVSILFLVFLH